MTHFSSLYARYYDVVYGGKDYAEESGYFEKLLKRNGVRPGASLLSFGAGTLNHELFFANRGYRVHGVELSPDMVHAAEEKIRTLGVPLSIEQGDMRSYRSTELYDAVLIPFNVVSYCNGEKELQATLKAASRALKKGGVLVFDCWNARVMQKDQPRDTWSKILVDDGVLYKLVRATPVKANNSFVRSLELVAITKSGSESYAEDHILFGWVPAKIRSLLAHEGFSTINMYEWMKTVPLTNTRWSMTVVALKK